MVSFWFSYFELVLLKDLYSDRLWNVKIIWYCVVIDFIYYVNFGLKEYFNIFFLLSKIYVGGFFIFDIW